MHQVRSVTIESNLANVYDAEFYRRRNDMTRYAAQKILKHVREILPPIDSAVDLGCGVGTWLSVLKDTGVRRVRGFDGPWVRKEYLEVPAEEFTEYDLTHEVRTGDRFALAISLEVAEHLPPDSAQTIVRSLTNLSDFVLFSAAIPGQQGASHVNEQWPDYWASLFHERGYLPLDPIRRRIWADANIPYPYRQNIILFVQSQRVEDLRIPVAIADAAALPLVHPELFNAINSTSISRALHDLKHAVGDRLWRRSAG